MQLGRKQQCLDGGLAMRLRGRAIKTLLCHLAEARVYIDTSHCDIDASAYVRLLVEPCMLHVYGYLLL